MYMASLPRKYTTAQLQHFKQLSGALLRAVEEAEEEGSAEQEDTSELEDGLDNDLSQLRARLSGVCSVEVDVAALMTAFTELADEHEYCLDALFKAQAVLQASKSDPADFKEVVAGCQYFERKAVVAARDELAADFEKAKEKLLALETVAASANASEKAEAAEAVEEQEEVVDEIEHKLQEKKGLISSWGGDADADAPAAKLLVRPVMTANIVGDRQAYEAADAASGQGGPRLLRDGQAAAADDARARAERGGGASGRRTTRRGGRVAQAGCAPSIAFGDLCCA